MEIKNFKFKKKYGQNFLIDSNITNKIANVIKDKTNSLVIEIGCGDGRLTKQLCNYYDKVLCYEIDEEVIPYLKDNLKTFNNYNIILGDFLKRDVNSDIKSFKYDKLYVVANLPYYITTPIIEKIISSNINPDILVFMVQKEVGDRLSAKVGTKEYSSLSVYLNYYYDIKKEFIVKRNCFLPSPNVDSVVVSFKKKDKMLEVYDEKLFFKLVRDSFKFKRKNIRNNLKEYNLVAIEKVLKKYNFDLNVRAEAISIDIFVDIANNLVLYEKEK